MKPPALALVAIALLLLPTTAQAGTWGHTANGPGPHQVIEKQLASRDQLQFIDVLGMYLPIYKGYCRVHGRHFDCRFVLGPS